ncbi:hypothetical protein FSP39_014058 [Pinctada imbricata]|uniref:Reverse transcriptase domain-containing protein n=1 Tax=Pinctada imbricata TaxID=66713 RepID=A0AA88XRF6_PINIB|nr:hypothetical protein FSP39_014058 [Pinctada imbricata]
MARRFDRNAKRRKRINRAMNRIARKSRKLKSKVQSAKQHVFNLTSDKLTDGEYLLLSRGLKFIPFPSTRAAKINLVKDFDEFARKMQCKYMFSGTDDDIHPFRTKSGFKPNVQSDSLKTYLDKTKLELTSIQVHEYYDNLCAIERDAIISLRQNEHIIIKKADENNTCVVMNKSDYINEGERQLQSIYYTEISNFDLSQLQEKILAKVIKMHNEGRLDKITHQFLCDTKYHPKIGRLYLLPKIHKLDKQAFELIKDNGFCTENIFPSCRPIISQNGSPTERISQYVDYFLIPIVNTHATYFRDSSDFILMMEGLTLPDDCLLVSYDVTSMYTNVQFEELITAVEKAYSQFDKTNYKIPTPPTKHIAYLLRLVLENNVFEFNSKVYKQIIGCAMGSRCSPSVCDIRMYEITTEIINKFPHKSRILYHGRYRDDGFIIYSGDENEIHELFAIANSAHPLLKFTYDMSHNQMDFLDTAVYKGARFLEKNVLDIKTFIKPTNTYQYLDRNSAHHPSVFKGFIKGETIMYLRNTSDKIILSNMLSELKCYLIKRGYEDKEVQDLIRLSPIPR